MVMIWRKRKNSYLAQVQSLIGHRHIRSDALWLPEPDLCPLFVVRTNDLWNEMSWSSAVSSPGSPDVALITGLDLKNLLVD